MALKVLVADHSESISKAIHLSLEDLAVKVQPITLDKLAHLNETSLSLEKRIIEMVHSFDPAIIFLDTLLAKINGYDLAKILKSDERIKLVPIILMYSSITGLDEEKFKASGADGILEKPFTQEKLRSLVTKYLQIDSSPLGSIGEEVELPVIEDLKEDIIKQIQDGPSVKDQGFSNEASKKEDMTLKPKGLINSDLELKELKMSLSELDGEEDFQQVNLFPSATSDTQKKEDHSDSAALDFSSIDFTGSPSEKKESSHQASKEVETVVETSVSKPKVSPNLFAKGLFQKGLKSSDTKAKISQKDINSKKKEIEDLLQKPTHFPQSSQEKEDSVTRKMDSAVTVPQFLQEKEDSVTDPSPEETVSFMPDVSEDNKVASTKQSNSDKPLESSSDTSFRLNITAENIKDDEIHIEDIESEEDMNNHIGFLTAPETETSEVSQEDKTRLKKLDEKAQGQLLEGLKEEMKKVIHEEVRKMVQDQIQRTLDKELPQIAKKLIKEEITRLLSEYK